jgi:hypothetical protein
MSDTPKSFEEWWDEYAKTEEYPSASNGEDMKAAWNAALASLPPGGAPAQTAVGEGELRLMREVEQHRKELIAENADLKVQLPLPRKLPCFHGAVVKELEAKLAALDVPKPEEIERLIAGVRNVELWAMRRVVEELEARLRSTLRPSEPAKEDE